MLELAKSCTFEPIVLNMCARWGGFAEKNREEEEEMKSPKAPAASAREQQNRIEINLILFRLLIDAQDSETTSLFPNVMNGNKQNIADTFHPINPPTRETRKKFLE